jgi:hypothetical protein
MMDKEEIEAGNKIIAEWMGLKQVMWPDEKELMWVNKNFVEDFTDFENFSNDSKFDWAGSLPQATKLQYHYNWNWLMEVFTKIEKIGETDKKYGTLCDITTNYIKVGHIVLDHKLQDYSTKIEGVFKAVVEFIKWHNDNIQ